MKAAYNRQTDDLIDRTRAVWKPRFGRDLTRDEAKQITTNVAGFFSVLAEWARKEKQDALRGVASEDWEARDEG